MGEFRKSFDKKRSTPSLKIYCVLLILFMKFYPIAEKDILWFGDVVEALAMFRKPKEIKLEAVDADKNCGFEIYCDELKKEYKRILSSDVWRFAEGNGDYSLCPSYSQVIPQLMIRDWIAYEIYSYQN